ncbi:MAG: hypothetical protein ACPGAD_00980 [Pseudomonadales bacterium]
MKLSQPLFALVTLVFTAGCATAPASPILRQSVIVDQKGVDPVAYATDLRECEAYAAQVATGQEVAVNAAGGAVLELDDWAPQGARLTYWLDPTGVQR